MQRNRLLSALLAATIGLAILPHPALGAGLVNRASMQLKSSYLLKASLNYAYGTISATERITVSNLSGSAISKLNLSVMPRAFGELSAIGTSGSTVARPRPGGPTTPTCSSSSGGTWRTAPWPS